jgi:hypothetical protein
LPPLRVQIQHHAPGLIVQSKFKASLAGDVLDKLRIELQ